MSPTPLMDIQTRIPPLMSLYLYPTYPYPPFPNPDLCVGSYVDNWLVQCRRCSPNSTHDSGISSDTDSPSVVNSDTDLSDTSQSDASILSEPPGHAEDIMLACSHDNPPLEPDFEQSITSHSFTNSDIELFLEEADNFIKLIEMEAELYKLPCL